MLKIQMLKCKLLSETTSIFDLKNLYFKRLGTGEKAEDLYFTLSGKILRNDFPLDDYILLLMLIILKLKIFYINLYFLILICLLFLIYRILLIKLILKFLKIEKKLNLMLILIIFVFLILWKILKFNNDSSKKFFWWIRWTKK